MLERVRSVVTGDRSPVVKALPGPETLPNLGISGYAAKRRLTGKTAERHMQAYGGTDAIDWVMDCVDLIAETASNADYHFERGDQKLAGTGRFGPLTTDGSAPPDLVKLLDRPNPFMDYTELIELAIIDFLLAGEFMWYKFQPDDLGRPQALYRLAPPLVQIELDNRGVPGKYIYTIPGGQPVEFAPRDIVHVKRPNPHDPWRGLGVIAGGPRVFDMDLAVTEQAARYYEQGTRLSGVLESDRTVPPSTTEKLRAVFRSYFGGPDNAGLVPVLDRGMTYNSISATAEDAQFVAITEMSKDRIARMFRVPLPLLGQAASGSGAGQAAKEAQRTFDNKTMRPFLNRLQSQISRTLTQAWGVDFIIDYEYQMPIEDKYNLAQAAAAVPGVQVKDLRTLLELPALQDQNEKWKEIDDMILNMPGQGSASGHPDANLAGEKGRPPNPGNRQAFPADGTVPPTAAVIKPPQSGIAAKALLDRIDDLRDSLD